MDRKLVPVLGLLLVASFYSLVSGPTSGTAPVSSSDAERKSARASSAAAKNTAGATGASASVRLVSRAELGPWNASCEFFLHERDVSPAISLDLLRPTATQLQQAESSPYVDSQPVNGLNAKAGLDSAPASSDRWCRPRPDYPLRFMVVTIPDPVNTHLSLFFDSRIEAVQWAAMDSGYMSDRYWLPWDPAAPSRFEDPEQQRAEAMLRSIRISQPGLQIFRCAGAATCQKRDGSLCSEDKACRDEGALFVFFVAETPTYGVNKAQLTNALDYIEQLAPADHGGLASLAVLGPSFSGSISSLREILLRDKTNLRFHVITSSATNEAILLTLLDVEARSRIDFETVAHTDAFALDRFLKSYVSADLHLHSCEVALLSESETAYGGGLGPETGADSQDCVGPISADDILHIRFPRDISHLRTAYPDQPAPPPAAGRTSPTSPGLTFDLKQVLGGEDDLPPFSLSQLPLAQESVLLDIASTLGRRKVRLVGIGATDIFDTLFVARFLKQFSPDIRIFVLNADVLLIRAAETFPLEGTLAVTTYPLISANQQWTYPSSTGDPGCPGTSLHLQFPSFFSEGTYNAFLALMDHPTCLRDYAWPDGPKEKTHEPPLWLTVVAHNGYAPVTILPPGSGASEKEQIPFVAMASKAGNPSANRFQPAPGFRHDPPVGAYLLLCGCLILLSLAHFVVSRISDWKLSAFPARVREFFSRENIFTQHVQKAFFMVAEQLLLVVTDVVVFLPVWVAARNGQSWFYWLIFLLCVVATLSVLISLFLCLREFSRGPRARERWFNDPHRLIWCGVVVTGACLALWVSLTREATAHTLAGSFFLLRCADLASGVSPLVPCLLLAIALFLWCRTQTHRVVLWEWRHPLLPAAAMDEVYGCGLARHQKKLDHTLRTVMPPGHAARITFLAVLVSPLLLRPWRPLAGLESSSWFFGFSSFDSLYLLGLILLYALIFGGWMRFLSLWSSLRSILLGLERPLLRRAFARLPKESSMTLLWNASSKRNYSRIRKSLECLQKLTSDPGAAHLPELPFYRDKLKASLQDPPSSSLDTSLALRIQQLQQTLHDTSDYLLRELLIPYWADTGWSGSLEMQAGSSSTSPTPSNQRYLVRGEEPHDPPDHIVMAEEFVARRFVGMIRYGFLQMGNLLFFLIASFVLSVASLRSYPFLAHRTIGWTLTLIALILGGGIVLVFAQMDRDAILSRLGNTEPGKLGKEFYFRVISYGALPVLTVLASQFPSIGRFLFSWVQPGLEAMK